MKSWLRGKKGGLIAFLAIAALVGGGLAWVTAAALRLEKEQSLAQGRLEEQQGLARQRQEAEQRRAHALAEHYDRLRLALWRLDSRVSPVLAKEANRPYSHYSAVYAPSVAIRSDGTQCAPGTVLEPSPLLNADLPDWMLLHFQADEKSGWASPQVLVPALAQRLDRTGSKAAFVNVTPRRQQILAEFSQHVRPSTLLASVQKRGLVLTEEERTLLPANNAADRNNLANSDSQQKANAGNFEPQQQLNQDYLVRKGQQARVMNESKQPAAQQDMPEVVYANTARNGQDWFSKSYTNPSRSEQVSISLSPMTPLWLTTADQRERLVVARLVQVGNKQVCQGMVLDWPRLQTLLTGEVADLFPSAGIQPVYEEVPLHPERTMTALPLQLDPGPEPVEPAAPLVAAVLVTPAGWTPLRVGLALAWLAALVALLAVGLGGWSLLDLSERRIRFVSAVTHELRTPLTTLRLYLDMLAGGLVKEERQKSEYLETLNAETERLSRLVGNVLDFSRLENQRPRLVLSRIALSDVLEQVRSTWHGRCQDIDKELVVENSLNCDTALVTDVQLIQQVLGNLIDNACKYSRGAADRRIWLRASAAGKRLVLEVEDRGPGVSARDRRSIFRPFRRGLGTDVVAGGVGLGLALASRWAHLLGGRLTLCNRREASGACFRFELPCEEGSSHG